MTKDFFDALAAVAPQVAIALIVGFFFAQIFGFKPISVMQKHGVIVALALIAGFVAVAIVAMIVRQPDPPISRVEAGATLGQFIKVNARSTEPRTRIAPVDQKAGEFVLEIEHTAPNDLALIKDICAYYAKLSCSFSDDERQVEVMVVE